MPIITDRDVEERLRNINAVPVPPLPPECLRDDTIKIFNVSPFDWTVSMGSFGTFYIAPCQEGKRVSRALPIKQVVPELIRDDHKKSHWNLERGEAIAKDIVGIGDNKSKSEDKTQWGVFISHNDVPTDAEISAAQAKYQQKLVEL